MPRYTFILEFNGGTYLSQAVADTPEQARTQWVGSLKHDEIEGLTPALHRQLIAELAEDSLSPVSGLVGVWCLFAALGELGVLVNVVQSVGAGGSGT